LILIAQQHQLHCARGGSRKLGHGPETMMDSWRTRAAVALAGACIGAAIAAFQAGLI
jgi:hypothetical protein